MKIRFNCNLDDTKNDVGLLNQAIASSHNTIPIPRIGETVVIHFDKWVDDKWTDNAGRTEHFTYSLEVVNVEYHYPERSGEEATVQIELQHPKMFGSIAEWSKYFLPYRYNR